jgi:hypothetical protein
MRALKEFLEAGWKLLTEFHTASWLVQALGLSVASIPLWMDWDNVAARPYIAAFTGFLWAVFFLCALGYSGRTFALPEFVSARDAVEMVNSALYDIDGWGQWIKAANEQGDMSPLLMGASMLSNRISIYGKPPGVADLKPVDKDVHWEMGRWSDDLSRMVRRNRPDQVLYSDLAFKRADLDGLIKSELATANA